MTTLSGSSSAANLDAAGNTRGQATEGLERCGDDRDLAAHISVMRPRSAEDFSEPQKRQKHISLAQATNIVAAVHYAKESGRSLVAHATIHWSGTDAWDDADGKRFARVREGLDKHLGRCGIPGGLTGIWCRECKAHTDTVHCHLLFHLPAEFCSGAKFLQIEAAINRLVARHGNGLWGEFAVNLTTHRNPDGLYLLKGGNRDVWRRFKIKKQWRESQGVIHGKRCGTTENIGRAARDLSRKRTHPTHDRS